ncbi:hypothetical protein N4G58_00015 [Edwardsiella piscicida]|nr:hypothetical protein N4G58_19110 [Edwardsiella piscicida]WCF13994.1 hypothetical protein N4G58_00015 [Edwardsiella piscicida]
MQRYRANKTRIAQALGISRSTLYKKSAITDCNGGLFRLRWPPLAAIRIAYGSSEG